MLFWKAKQRLAVSQADLILTVSEYSRQSIIDYFGLPQSRVRAITEGPNSIFRLKARDEELAAALSRHGLQVADRFLLYVGGISPHKNLRTLLEAFFQITRDVAFSDVKLALVGDYEGDPFYSDYPWLRSRVEQLALEERVLFMGFVADEDLAHLYNAATLFVLPSLEEGFGLPVVEAMSCGAPVVCSNTGSLPEVVGEAGRFFDPLSLDSMVRVIREVLSDEAQRVELSRKGLSRSREFTWEAAASRTAELFAELLANKSNPATQTRRRQTAL
jgi:glycosyltransferase involved in cell wall biosynthesis